MFLCWRMDLFRKTTISQLWGQKCFGSAHFFDNTGIVTDNVWTNHLWDYWISWVIIEVFPLETGPYIVVIYGNCIDSVLYRNFLYQQHSTRWVVGSLFGSKPLYHLEIPFQCQNDGDSPWRGSVSSSTCTDFGELGTHFRYSVPLKVFSQLNRLCRESVSSESL